MSSIGHKWGCIKSSSLVSWWQRICAMWQCNSCANALFCSQMCWSWRCSCSAELNRFRGRAVRTALLSCLCHRGLLYSSDYISRERLRQLNFMHKAHLPVAHGTSLWVWNPQRAPQRKGRSLTGIIRLGSHFKKSPKFSTKGCLCMVLLVSKLKYCSCNKSIL